MTRSLPSLTRRVALFLATILAACARFAAPLPPAPPGDALAVVRQRAAAVHTLRARFDAVARFPAGERRSTGVLIVRPPDDARMRLVAPFGLTVFDALRRGGRTWINAPLTAESAEASMAFMRVGPADSLLFGAAGAESCRPAPARTAGTAEYWCGSRWLAVDRATATVSAEAEVADGAVLVSRSYGDYRPVDGVPLPYRVRIDYPRQQVTVDITVDRYELNPPLRDEQFAPPATPAAAPRPPA